MSESNFKSMESSEEYNGTLSESSISWSFLSASWKPTVFAETSEAFILDFAFACRGFPLNEVQVRNMAILFANENGLHAFSQKKNNHTGYNWFKGFLKRHPELCVKRAEGLSAARSSAMNKPSVEKWFVEYHATHTKVEHEWSAFLYMESWWKWYAGYIRCQPHGWSRI